MKRKLQHLPLKSGTADFFGMNCYTANLISNADPPTGAIPSLEHDMGVRMSQDPNWPQEGVGYMKVGIHKMMWKNNRVFRLDGALVNQTVFKLGTN